MARIKLDINTQIKITKYLQNQPTAREEFDSWLKAKSAFVSAQASKNQLTNAVLGLPLTEAWYTALNEWASELPLVGPLSTVPPAAANVFGPDTQHVVYWLPGQVERRVGRSGTVCWRAADVCERFGLKRSHAQTHKGTLQEGEDYELVARGGASGQVTMWLTKRGALKLLLRSREAGVIGSPLNKLFNEVINVFVEFSDTGLVIHKARAEQLAEDERQRALEAQRRQILETGPPPPQLLTEELQHTRSALEQTQHERDMLQAELDRLTGKQQ
jgi:hypothetical protein